MTISKDDITRALQVLDDDGFQHFLDFMEGKWDTPWITPTPPLETEQQVEARTQDHAIMIALLATTLQDFYDWCGKDYPGWPAVELTLAQLRRIDMEARTISYGDIGWAVNHVRLGHKMRRTPWAAGTYVALDTSEGKPGIIRLFTASQPDQMWHNTNADVLAGDWVMAEPTLPGEYHS